MKKDILPNVAFVCPVFDMVTKSFKHALCRGDVTCVKHLVTLIFPRTNRKTKYGELEEV